MSSPVGYPQRNAYPMFSSTSQGDVPVGKNGANLIPVMASTTPDGGLEIDDLVRSAVQIATPKPIHKVRRFLLWGDSGVNYGNEFFYLSGSNAMNDGSGTCTINIGAHTILTGMSGFIVNSSDKYWSARKVLTRVSGTQISFPLDPRAAATLNETGRSPGGSSGINLVLDQRISRSSMFHVLNAMLGSPWECIGNRAANGKPCRDMLLDLERDVFNMDVQFDAVWAQLGTNDFRVISDSVDVAFARVTEAIQKIVARGYAFFYQPWMSDDSRDTPSMKPGYARAANRFEWRMRRWCADQRHVYYMPRLEAITDPTSPLGYAPTNWLHTDGLHDTPISAMASAKCAFDAYRNLIPKFTRDLPASAQDMITNDGANIHNMYRNGLFLTTTGGTVATDTGANVPAYVDIMIPSGGGAPTTKGYNGTSDYFVARNVSSDGDAYGNNLAVRATMAANEQLGIELLGNISGVQAGQYVRWGIHLQHKLVSGVRPKFLAVYSQPSLSGSLNPASIKHFGDTNSPATISLPFDTDEVILTPWFLVPATLTAIQLRVWLIMPATGGGVIDVLVGRPMEEIRSGNPWA